MASRLGTLSDDALLASARGGRAEAFSELYDRHAAAAYGLARRLVPAPEDAVQEAFLDLWRHGDAFDPARGSLRSFLLGIVRHRCIGELPDDQRRVLERPTSPG